MTAQLAYRKGYGVFGIPVMKFTLTYDGPLPSSGNKPKPEHKWDIRRKLDPQLRDLWSSHPALRAVEDNKHYPKSGGATIVQAHHQHPGPVLTITPAVEFGNHLLLDPTNQRRREIIDLCVPIERYGAWFRPLVRESYALHCGLKITFLRQEMPGKVYQGGDLDGRMKTLLDALAMPQHREQVLGTTTESAPIYCLLEDDALVSGLQIESERLLADKSQSPDYVRLNIEVDVRIRQATIYNQSFLG